MSLKNNIKTMVKESGGLEIMSLKNNVERGERFSGRGRVERFGVINTF